MLRKTAATGVAALLSLGAMPALADELVGVFQTEGGGQDYEVTYCGDGTQLCGKLVALHGADDTEGNRAFLGSYIVNQMAPTGKNTWKGQITINQNTANGTARLIPGKEIRLRGCAYIVLCAEFRMKQIS
jgi:uncharacterized protein (DUF2147 family)